MRAGSFAPAYVGAAPTLQAGYAAMAVPRQRQEAKQIEVKQRVVEVPEIVAYQETVTRKPKITQNEVIIGQQSVPQLLQVPNYVEVPRIEFEDKKVEVPQLVGTNYEPKVETIAKQVNRLRNVPAVCTIEKTIEQPSLEIYENIEKVPCFTQWYEQRTEVPKVIEQEVPIRIPKLAQQTVEINNEYISGIEAKDVEKKRPQIFIRNATKTKVVPVKREMGRIEVPVPCVQNVEIPVEVFETEMQESVAYKPELMVEYKDKVVAKVVPQVTEYNINIPQIQTIEKVIQIPQIQPIEKIEYVPEIQVEVVERRVEKVIFEEVIKEVPVPQVQTIEKHVEIEEIVYEDKVEYVPEIQIEVVEREVPKVVIEYVEKEVIVPQIQEVIKEVIVPQYVTVDRNVVDVTVMAQEVFKDVPVEEVCEVPQVSVVEQRVKSSNVLGTSNQLPPVVKDAAPEIVNTRPAGAYQQVYAQPAFATRAQPVYARPELAPMGVPTSMVV